MTTPRVSVIVPTRNAAKYLREALDSIFSQTFSDFELLIVDDNSTDDTLEILANYNDDRLSVLRGPCRGLAAALNFAMRQAKGELIARMDADDIAHPTRFQKQIEFLDNNPQVGVCGTLFQEFEDGDAIHDHMENVRYADLLRGCYVGHPTAMFRLSVFVENDLFYNESLRFSEDYDLWSRAIRFTLIANIRENLLQYRRHRGNISSANVALMADIDVSIKLKMIDYLCGEFNKEYKSILISLLRNEYVDENRRESCIEYISNNIKQINLCSRLEMVAFFHQMKNFDVRFISSVARDEIKNLVYFVISFNQLTYIKCIVDFFTKIGATNVVIIDNNSSYQPLLDYLETVPYQVRYMDRNYGHMVLFENSQFKDVIDNSYFVLTDPDILPIKECPDDFVSRFLTVLLGHAKKNKVGFSLKIDDLPDYYELKENVIAWESRFYKHSESINGVKIYDAPIDTTFALYRPRREWWTNDFYEAFRVGAPYTARHLPWYRDLGRPTEEELFYRKTDVGSSNWNGTMSSNELHTKYATRASSILNDLAIPFDPELGDRGYYASVVVKALRLYAGALRIKRFFLCPFKKSRRRYRKQLKIVKFILRS